MNQIVLEIFKWYKKKSRDLPWRNTNDPYKIWLSEIILQQTQVKQGMSYYENFIKEYPTVNALARADEGTILKLWQGLGYYSRARNLHKAAQIIMTDYGGTFPESYPDILKLPGIGEYTAAAIASFAYGQGYPVLDGNVYRFISRLFDINLPIDEQKNRKIFINLLEDMIAGHSPAVFNNAMMEMGAIICKPDNPLCNECPVNLYCTALKNGTVGSRPVKSKKTKTKIRFLNFIHLDYRDGFYLEKRTGKDIWQNLFQLPLIETKAKCDNESVRERLKEIISISGGIEVIHKMHVRHLLTHQVLEADFWYILLEKEPAFLSENFLYTSIINHKMYPIPKLIDNYLLLL